MYTIVDSGISTNLVHSGVLPRGLEARSADLLSTLGALTGINAATKTSNCWQGEDGDYVNYVKNEGTADMILLVWGPGGSFVNTIQPLITTTVAANETVPLSFANGASGAMSVAYEGTTMAWGQIANTWVEHTFSGDWSTIDVSREPNMNGDSMTVVTPGCVSDMDTCSFVCNNGATSCWEAGSYTLQNCNAANGGGSDAAAMNGGCNGMPLGSKLYTYISQATA